MDGASIKLIFILLMTHKKGHCHARAKNFQEEGHPLSEFANLQLEISYKYLLLATQFNAFMKDRPGFYAKFKALSDRSWAAGQNLIKYITKRGGHVKFIDQKVLNDQTLAEFNEFQAMAIVLDTEKSLFEKASKIHQIASNDKVHQDPEVAHYIEEEFLGNLATSIRQYSGYANDLKNLYVGSNDISMDNYLFDQYLQKA